MNVSANIRQLTNIFILFFLALSGALVYWQVGVAGQVTANPTSNFNRNHINTPVRGNIFDRNGILLAYSVPNPNVVGGYTRVYTDPTLAGLIGYYVPGYPITGIENQYCTLLNGGVEDQYCLRPGGSSGSNQLDNTVNSILHRPAVGNDIYLTIDDRIQQLADQHFDDATTGTNNSNRGSIIVSDPHSGDILAMVSRPGFDPNQMVQTLQQNDLSYYNGLVANPDNPLLERPLDGLYPPGSTYKTLTLIAGLDSGKTTLTQEFDQQHALGPIVIAGQRIGPEGNNIGPPDANYTLHYPVDTEYGFTHSDNIIYAQIGVETGLATWLDYNNRFYVGQHIPFDLPVAVSQVLPPGKDTMADNELAADSFGQGTDFVTPFQMSLIDNVVANDGQLMLPRLIHQIADHQAVSPTPTQTNYQGNPITTYSPQLLGTPMNQQTAIKTRQAMYGVTRCGSGLLVPPLTGSKASIIAKTGTAQIGGPGTNPHGWMITAAPYTVDAPGTLPVLTIVAMKENDGHGADAVGPLIAHTYEDIFAKQYVQAQFPSIPTTQQYCGKTGLLQYS